MTETDQNTIIALKSWVRTNSNRIDLGEPAHVHIDAFVPDWKTLSVDSYIQIVRSLATENQKLQTVVVFNIAEDTESEPLRPQSFEQILSMNQNLSEPAAIYLPSRFPERVVDDYYCISRYRLPAISIEGYSSRMTCIQHVESVGGVRAFDTTIDFVQSNW